MHPSRPEFPFSAVVGRSSLKTALILLAINPRIGGVLISGPRGCAKSTLARGLADILPEGEGRRSPFVNLPLGATEDRLVGTLDLQRVLDDQQVAFQPGLMAQAHGGVLYVDEVNLLPDALVDVLLDTAARGINVVERDGVSHSHDADFALVGTMNPDEGELRPQLLDRFGLMVELDSRFPLSERVDIVRQREAFDLDPEGFLSAYQDDQRALRQRIAQARATLNDVVGADWVYRVIAERCEQARVHGVRADVVWFRAARAHAAWRGSMAIESSDIDAVEPWVLAHRRNATSNPPNPGARAPQSQGGANGETQAPPPNGAGQGNATDGQWGAMPPQTQAIVPTESPDYRVPAESTAGRSAAFQSRAGTHRGRGALGRSAPSEPSRRIHWFETLLANRGEWPPRQIRFRKSRGGRARLHLVLLDTSASTLANRWFGQAKSLVAYLANHVYRAREHMAVLGFGNDRVEDILPRGRAPKDFSLRLNALPGGGGTPLRQALRRAETRIRYWRRRNPQLSIHTYLFTDGRTRQSVRDIRNLGDCVVVDLEQSAVRRGRAQTLAQELGARYLTLPQRMETV